MERHSGGDKRAVVRVLPAAQLGEPGQSTVEFAVVTAAFLCIAVGLGALWRAFGGGLLVAHAIASASHHIQAVAPAAVSDIFLY